MILPKDSYPKSGRVIVRGQITPAIELDGAESGHRRKTWTAADRYAERGVGVDFIEKSADERDLWCVPNGTTWTIVPEGFDTGDGDRLIIALWPGVEPRVVGPTRGVGWVSIAGLEASTRLGRFNINLVVQYPQEALAIADALRLAVSEQERWEREWLEGDSSETNVASRRGRSAPGGVGRGNGLSRDEIVALLDSRPKPDWIRGLSANSQRLYALIETAVEGREWAIPYIFPFADDPNDWRSEFPLIGFHYDLWRKLLGGSAEEVEMAAMRLVAVWRFGEHGRWGFNT